MNCTFYNLGKKKNSTLLPGVGTNIPIDLKEPCSKAEPEITIRSTTAPTYNYAYIPNFSRYYFIRDWTWKNGIWSARLEVDLLASFKTAILGLSCYIERSASNYDENIIDTYYPAKPNATIQNTAISAPWTALTVSSGTFILGVVGLDTGVGRLGAVSYYAVDTAGLNSLLNFLFSNDIWQASGITEIGEGLYKSIFNPFQYVVSCVWVPVTRSAISTTATTIKLGYWDTQVSAYGVTLYVTGVLAFNATLPAHPQSGRGAYLNYSPYTTRTLYIPPFGSIPIDSDFYARGNILQCDCHIDIITGQATLRVGTRTENGTVAYFTERSGLLGVQIQLAQVLSDYSHSLSTLQAGISGGVAGMVAGAIGAGVMSAIEAKSPKVTSSGSNGSLISFSASPVIVSEFYLVADEDLADYGRPCGKKVLLSTLSGYVKCAEAHPDFPGLLAGERDQLETLLLGGIYIE